MSNKRPLTFRMVHFQSPDRFIGVAWNYAFAALVSTRDFATYTEAREALAKAVDDLGKGTEVAYELRWFDGAFVVPPGSDQMIPA